MRRDSSALRRAFARGNLWFPAREKIRLYLFFAGMSIRTALAHRSAYWAGVVGQWLSYGASFATLYIVVSGFETLAGWTAHQVLFLYALNLLTYALAATFFFNPCMRLAERIRTGEFDSALTKPVSPFGHEFYRGFNFGYVSHVTLSVCVIIFSAAKAELAVSLSSLLSLLGMLLGGVLIQAAFLIAASAAGFVMIQGNPFFYLLWDLKDFTNYPLSIYHTSIQILLTAVLPLAFIGFYPAAALLGVDTGMLFPAWLGYLTPLVGLAFFGLSLLIWNWGLSKYQSAGG